MSWMRVHIGNLGRVVTGKTPPTKQRQYYEGEYPFITPSDLEYDSYRVRTTETTLSEEARTKFQNQFLPENAVVFTCIASVGKIGITTTNSLTNQQINSIIVNDEHDGKFVYYLLRHEARRIRSMCSGVATPIINKRDFEKIEVEVPCDSLVEKRIASILSTYDDLIENNRRRIQLLEQAARLFYKEWFVNLRFPGHEHVTITGGVPEGWSTGIIEDIAIRIKENYTIKDEDLRLVDLARIRSKTLSLSEAGYSSDLETSRIIFEEDDILFSSIRPYLHKVVLAPFKGITNTSVFVIRADEDDFQAYATALLSDDFAIAYANQHSTGTKMPVVKWTSIASMPIVIPPRALLSHYQVLAGSMLWQIKSFYFINQKLTRARDLLLPRLMNREVTV